LDSKINQRLLAATGNTVYAGAISGLGFLLFTQGSSLMAQRFDSGRLTLMGDPFQLVERIHLPVAMMMGYGAFSASANGVLAYQAGGPSSSQLLWLDRQGRKLGAIGDPAEYSNPALSRDDKKLVVSRKNPQAGFRNLWLF